MPSHFDELLKELARHEMALARHDGGGFVKSLTAPVMRGFDAVDRATRAADALVKALGNPFAKPTLRKPAMPSIAERREMMAKALTGLNAKVGQAVANGSLTAIEASQLQSRLHALAARAAEKGVTR